MVFDAVIIGAGPSGLAAAARLAHFGVRVCVLEAHSRPGGLNSWHHVKGREVSTGLHAFTNIQTTGRGGPLGKLFRQLRLKISDLKLRVHDHSSIRFPSATLRFSNEPELLREQVAETFPDQVDGFDRLRRLIRETDEGELTARQSSARDVLERFLGNPLLVDMLFCPVMFYGNPGGVGDGRDRERERPDMDWLLFCVLWKCMFESGLGYPADGIRPLWQALAKRIVDDGGVVRLKTPVRRLLTRGGKVVAAGLESGEEVEGDMFFSSAGAVETEALLGEPATKPVGSIAVAEGICLMDRSAAKAGMTDTIVYYSFDDRLRFRRPEGLIDDRSGVVCAPGNYVPNDDENIVKVSQLANYQAWKALSPEAYAFAKNETAAAMSLALGRLGIVPVGTGNGKAKFPPFDDLFTPLTVERYTRHAGGAIYGSPVKSRSGATSRSNLFLIGADQGFHGIVGAMLSGVAMVNLHCLQNMK